MLKSSCFKVIKESRVPSKNTKPTETTETGLSPAVDIVEDSTTPPVPAVPSLYNTKRSNDLVIRYQDYTASKFDQAASNHRRVQRAHELYTQRSPSYYSDYEESISPRSIDSISPSISEKYEASSIVLSVSSCELDDINISEQSSATFISSPQPGPHPRTQLFKEETTDDDYNYKRETIIEKSPMDMLNDARFDSVRDSILNYNLVIAQQAKFDLQDKHKIAKDIFQNTRLVGDLYKDVDKPRPSIDTVATSKFEVSSVSSVDDETVGFNIGRKIKKRVTSMDLSRFSQIFKPSCERLVSF